MAALWAAAAAVAWRRRFADTVKLHAVLAVACGLGLVSMARVFGGFYDYVIRWMWVLAALVAVAVAWTAWLAVAGARRALAVAGLGAAAVALVAATFGAAGVEPSGPRNSRIVAGLAPAVAAELDPHGRYLVRWDDSVSLGATGVGLLLDLERRGFAVGADPFQRAGVLPHRVVHDECDADAVVRVVVGPASTPVPAADEVATVDARTPAERERFADVAAEIDGLLRSAGAGDLVPVADANLIAVGLDPRLPDRARDLVQVLVELGLPATASVTPVQGCGP
jgi:hypothetical protein